MSQIEKTVNETDHDELQLLETIQKMKQVMAEKDHQIENLKNTVKKNKYKGRFDKKFYKRMFSILEGYGCPLEEELEITYKELYEKFRYKSKYTVYEEIKSLLPKCHDLFIGTNDTLERYLDEIFDEESMKEADEGEFLGLDGEESSGWENTDTESEREDETETDGKDTDDEDECDSEIKEDGETQNNLKQKTQNDDQNTLVKKLNQELTELKNKANQHDDEIRSKDAEIEVLKFNNKRKGTFNKKFWKHAIAVLSDECEGMLFDPDNDAQFKSTTPKLLYNDLKYKSKQIVKEIICSKIWEIFTIYSENYSAAKECQEYIFKDGFMTAENEDSDFALYSENEEENDGDDKRKDSAENSSESDEEPVEVKKSESANPPKKVKLDSSIIVLSD